MISIEDISKSFLHRQVLNAISFSIHEGEVLGLLGPNGAGKTTLMRIVNQIIVQDKGTVSFHDRLLREKDLIEIGYLPEERGLYPNMTVEKHILFLGKLRGLTKKEAADRLEYWLDKFEIQDWRKKRIEELSKGMAQKVQFIATVLHEPSVLILDEPFSGFDPINIELIRTELLQLKEKGCAIILSTHNMNNVEEICDRVVLMNKGKVVLQGKTRAIREQYKEGLYKISFTGNMIAFANALWVGYEIIDKVVHGTDNFTVFLKMRKENKINDLLSAIMQQVSITAVEEVLPGMESIFIRSITTQKEETSA